MAMNNKVFQWSKHRELWKWLSENPENGKDDWVAWEYNGGTVDSVSCECFACEYIEIFDGTCRDCPLEFPLNHEGEPRCYKGGLWRKWELSEDMEERTRLALAIMDLPLKDGVDWV